jgi:hypothetical protein
MSDQNAQTENNMREALLRSILIGQNNVQFREEHKETNKSESSSDTDYSEDDDMYTKELEILYVLAKNNSKLCEALLSIVRNE